MEKGIKKALIITYYWPPGGGAGVQRWLKFVKYLRDYGWEPVVYTPENPEYPEIDESLLKDIPLNLTVIKQPIREPYKAYKRFIGQDKEKKIQTAFLTEDKKPRFTERIAVWIRGNFFIPDARKFWIKPSVKYLISYLKEHPVDAIITTGPPHSMHLIGLKLHQKLFIPWLADFRDPWTNIDFYNELMLTKTADRKHRKLEKQVLKTATWVSVISPSMAENFNSLYSRQYEVITNGYDPEDINTSGMVKLDQKFSIAHIGSLVKTRNPKVLWKVLSEIITNQPEFASDLEIKLVGKMDIIAKEDLDKYKLWQYVNKIDYLPHDEVVNVQQQSQVLLLLINDSPNAKMILTGKFFEYMASKRPILCIGPVDGNAAVILKETNTGKISGFEDSKTLKGHILDYYNQYKAGKLELENTSIEKYSRKSLTKRIIEVIDQK
ncbi:glycosyltransferase [candidate division KSB1 bacterium]